MRENSEVIGDLFKKAWTPKPEISLLSQRQLSKLPMVQVVAVDPRNPHEIDDAFRVIKRPNRSMDVSVVFPRAGLIPFTSPEFNEALDNGWSVYPGDDKYIPMISNVDLVTKQLSLIEGELTPGVELSFQLTSKGNTINAGIRHVAVDTKQIVYEDYGHQLRNGEHSKVIQAVNLIRKGRNRPALNPRKFRNNGYTPDKKYSSEERYARNIVQELMIHAN
jgi:exoribonuclease R